MSDFRISVGLTTSTQRELDWSFDKRSWGASEREDGSANPWQDVMLKPTDVLALTAFFRLGALALPGTKLLALSPETLVLLHQEITPKPTLQVKPCIKCADHAIVSRHEVSKGWLKYGRTCDFSWLRGVKNNRV